MARDLLDTGRTARRVRRLVLIAGVLGLVGLVATWAVERDLTASTLLLWGGLAALSSILGAMAVVAAAAFRGMLRAGDRLSERDVGLIPPQWRSRDGGQGP